MVAVTNRDGPTTYRDKRNNCSEPASKITTPQTSEAMISFRVLICLKARAEVLAWDESLRYSDQT